MSKNVFSCLAKLWKGFCPGGNDMYEYTQQKYTGFWGLNYTFEFYCLGFIFQVLSTCPPCSNLSWNLFRCILRPSVPGTFETFALVWNGFSTGSHPKIALHIIIIACLPIWAFYNLHQYVQFTLKYLSTEDFEHLSIRELKFLSNLELEYLSTEILLSTFYIFGWSLGFSPTPTTSGLFLRYSPT